MSARRDIDEPASHQPMASADATLADLDERALVDACLSNRAGAFDLVIGPRGWSAPWRAEGDSFRILP
jgi:hypothetical protein